MDLTDNGSYIESCVDICKEKLADYSSVKEIESDLGNLNAYPNLDKLDEPNDVVVLDKISDDEIEKAKRCVLDGRFFAEHAAAGEATRLGMGTKYLINVAEELTNEQIAKLIGEEKGRHVAPEAVLEEATCNPDELLPISLGTRHMLQYSFDIIKLALEMDYSPEKALFNQRILIILNETTAKKILQEFMQHSFFGFERENVMFMIQKSYHGIDKKGDTFIYDENSPKRLHNHGQMVMQQTMDKEIFYLDEIGAKVFMSSRDFGDVLKGFDDKLSYCIEDMVFLKSSIDFRTLALALQKGREGYQMLMEIVGNNPDNPQKGGMAAFDKVLKRNVMIESFQLKGIQNKDIIFLNKNFNHYPSPYSSWKQLKENGLNMPFCIKGEHIYFQPVQGDINFLVKTAMFQSKVLEPILHWKSPATTPLMVKHMRLQDQQEGFKEHAKKYKAL